MVLTPPCDLLLLLEILLYALTCLSTLDWTAPQPGSDQTTCRVDSRRATCMQMTPHNFVANALHVFTEERYCTVP